ncbi:MAG: type II secretion system protein [Methylotenera sp.]|uniref:type II secretion system protein n=1 Tax=Methylotenera sp. TaxID=2051956 RepID=UPI00180AE5BD|nr:type II secretion system protein [Methylotenera sp.]NOU25004.1 type II secretion system protein [Methylotenera sp.]
MFFSLKVRGFTFIELMVTLAILALLASIATPLVQVSMQRTKEQKLTESLRQIREAIDAYKKASDEGHIKKSAEESGYPATLSLLVDGVEDIKDPKRRKIFFLRKLPQDPIQDEVKDGDDNWGKRSYQSPADDPKEGDDVFDVYSTSNELGLNGVAYREW